MNKQEQIKKLQTYIEGMESQFRILNKRISFEGGLPELEYREFTFLNTMIDESVDELNFLKSLPDDHCLFCACTA